MPYVTLCLAMFCLLSGPEKIKAAPEDIPLSQTENVLSLEIRGLSFAGPTEINSGWTTIRIRNDSGMTHHGLVYRLPDGITEEMLSEQVVRPIQEGLTANIAGDLDKAAEIMQTIPAWIADLGYMGGPGMMSHGVLGGCDNVSGAWNLYC